VALVAALRERLRLFRRRAVVRRQEACAPAPGLSLLPLLICLALAGAIGIATTTPSGAQSFTYNPRPPKPTPPPPNSASTANIAERSSGTFKPTTGGTTVRVGSNSKDSVATRSTMLGSR